VRALIQAGVDLEMPDNVADSTGSLLAVAARYNSLDAARLLLDAGANVNIGVTGRSFHAKQSPVDAALEYGHADMLELLVPRADLEVINDGVTVLSQAIPLLRLKFSPDGALRVFRMLLAAGANPNGMPHLGYTALVTAAAFHCMDIIQLLLEGGADATVRFSNGGASGFTVLHALTTPFDEEYGSMYDWSAIEEELPIIAKLMVARGANVLAVSDDAKTALHLAAGSGHPALVHYYLDEGADIEGKTTAGDTPLHWAACSPESFAAAKALIERGADVHALDADGADVHTVAREANNTELCAYLEYLAEG
jgi:ankyrin repeat protein